MPVAATDNILSTTDKRGWLTHVNADFLRISGFPSEELIGQPHNVLRHPDMPRLAFEQLWQNLKDGRSWMGLVKNRCKNGDHYWVKAYVTPIRGADGEIVEYQSVRTTPPDDASVARAERLYAAAREKENDKGEIGVDNRRAARPGFLRLVVVLYALCSVPATVAAMVGESTLTAIALLALSAGLFAGGLYWLGRPLRRIVQDSRAVVDDPLAEEVFFGVSSEFSSIRLASLKLSTELDAVAKRLADSAGRV